MMETGVKHDQAKIKMGLISSRFLRGLADVLTQGAEKYAAHNWRKGMATSRYYDALQRHLTAWNDGEDNDPEWGKSHLYHAACCLMFLAETVEVRPDLDDRYKHGAKTGDELQTAKGDSLSEEAAQHRGVPDPASGHFRNPRLPSVGVRPLCGVGVEEFRGPTQQASGVQPPTYTD